MINKPKFSITYRSRLVKIAVLSAVCINFTGIQPVLAKNIFDHGIFSAKTEQVLSQSTEDRMFYPTNTAPDKIVAGVITAYSSTVDQCDSDPFIAASGKRVYDGMIAANFLPLGTKVKIPSLYGDKIFTVDDRMNARYGYGRMDIWMDAPRSVVNAFGVKRVDVEIYYEEPAVKTIAKR